MPPFLPSPYFLTTALELDPVDPLAPEDVLVPDSDDELSTEQRSAKRQRIEVNAKHYLEGGQLYISSAQLKGPFDSGWQNPWRANSQSTTSYVAIPGRSPLRSAGGQTPLRSSIRGDDHQPKKFASRRHATEAEAPLLSTSCADIDDVGDTQHQERIRIPPARDQGIIHTRPDAHLNGKADAGLVPGPEKADTKPQSSAEARTSFITDWFSTSKRKDTSRKLFNADDGETNSNAADLVSSSLLDILNSSRVQSRNPSQYLPGSPKSSPSQTKPRTSTTAALVGRPGRRNNISTSFEQTTNKPSSQGGVVSNGVKDASSSPQKAALRLGNKSERDQDIARPLSAVDERPVNRSSKVAGHRGLALDEQNHRRESNGTGHSTEGLLRKSSTRSELPEHQDSTAYDVASEGFFTQVAADSAKQANQGESALANRSGYFGAPHWPSTWKSSDAPPETNNSVDVVSPFMISAAQSRAEPRKTTTAGVDGRQSRVVNGADENNGLASNRSGPPKSLDRRQAKAGPSTERRALPPNRSNTVGSDALPPMPSGQVAFPTPSTGTLQPASYEAGQQPGLGFDVEAVLDDTSFFLQICDVESEAKKLFLSSIKVGPVSQERQALGRKVQ